LFSLIDVTRLLSRGCDSQAKVGIGASSTLHAAVSKDLSRLGCDLRLTRFRDSDSLVSALGKGNLDAAVRGTLGSGSTMLALRLEFGLKRVMRTAIMENSQGKRFLMTPVGIDEGMALETRLELVENTVAYFSRLRWKPSIGILSKGRLEDVGRGEEIRSSVEEGELMARKLRNRGYSAKHYAILIEDAVEKSDLVVAPDGITGNLIFRSIYFVGGGKAYGAPVVNLQKVFVDTSRAKPDFSDSVMIAAGLAETDPSRRSRA